jgi:flagellar export protein FliJ
MAGDKRRRKLEVLLRYRELQTEGAKLAMARTRGRLMSLEEEVSESGGRLRRDEGIIDERRREGVPAHEGLLSEHYRAVASRDLVRREKEVAEVSVLLDRERRELEAKARQEEVLRRFLERVREKERVLAGRKEAAMLDELARLRQGERRGDPEGGLQG